MLDLTSGIVKSKQPNTTFAKICYQTYLRFRLGNKVNFLTYPWYTVKLNKKMNFTQFTDFQTQNQLSPFQQNISLNNILIL